jgi:hypothetical protein
MRRVIILVIMLIVPLQFAWSAVAGLHGHVGEDVAALGFHTHDDDHHDHHDQTRPDHTAAGNTDKDHSEDGHHGSHYHPVFSSILMASGLRLDFAARSGPIAQSPAAFLSHTPPLLDRPPLARA